MFQTLAHESTHNFLLGHSAHGALVLNDTKQLYPSPLRMDDRPMDGMYHATFVLARMNYALQRLLDANILAAEEVEEAQAAQQRNAQAFQRGLETVNQHAKLSDMGKTSIQDAQVYMSR